MDLPVQLLQLGIKRGSILLSDIFDDIDHAKFFAVIGIYDDRIAGFFFINSRIHPVLMTKPKQFAMQYPLRKSNYNFLRYDSFLAANNLLTRSIADLAQSIQNGHTSIIDQLTDDDLSCILATCRESDLFSAKEKKHFFY